MGNPMAHHRALSSLAAGLLALSLAACGSNLSPKEVAQTGGDPALGSASGGSAAGVPGEEGAVPGAPGTVPGAGSSGGSGSVPEGGAPGAPGGDGAAPPATGENAPGGDGDSASCDGFKNQVGITDDKIVIANASDISGPVPGLFESSQQATKAYVAYFNATTDICGRKLEVLALDTRTDAGADQQAYTRACAEAFAAVGSMSGFDNGGAATAQSCGLPDLRATAVLPERQACTTCFGAQAVDSSTFQNAVPDHILKSYPDGAENAAMVYINAGAAAPNAENQVRAMERRGMNFVYVKGVDIAEFNYAPYVQQMKDAGVEYVQWIGPYQSAVRLAQAMQQQSFAPEVFALDPTGYAADYVESGGDAVEGTRVFINTALFTDKNPEVQLYLSWLNQVSPGAQPSYFGLYSWSATRLFVEQSLALGGKLSRQQLIAALGKVDDWTSNGLHAPQHVGSKKTSECWRWIKLDGGNWVPDGSAKYLCSGVTSA